MKLKSLMLLMVAVGCGLIAAYAATQGTNSSPEKVTVLIINQKEVPPNQPISQEWVSYISLPKNEIPFDAVTNYEELEQKAFKLKPTQGTVICQRMLTDKYFASTEIRNGRAVYTVKVDAEKSHSGQIRPKDRVDVFAAYSMSSSAANGGRPQMKTKQILSGIEIFSIDSIRSTSDAENQKALTKTVSLLLEPSQIPIVMMAEQKGDITLALRNKKDPELVRSLDGKETQDHKALFTESDFDKLLFGQASITPATPNKENTAGPFWEIVVYTQKGKETYKLPDIL